MLTIHRLVTHRPWVTVGLWVVLLLGGATLANQIGDRLSQAGYTVAGSESDQVEHILSRDFGREGREQLHVVLERHSAQTASGLHVQARRVRATLGAEPYVNGVGAAEFARDGRVAILPVALSWDLDQTQRHVDALQSRLASRVKGARLIGNAVTFNAANDFAKEDLSRSERIALPVSMLILTIAFISLVAAAVPLVLALVSLTVIFGTLSLLTWIVDVNVFVTNMATLLGIGLSIDYALFFVSRYREVRKVEPDPVLALRTTMETTGRAVIFSALTVAVSLAALLSIGVGLLSAMAIGSIAASVIAGAAATTLLPAVVLLLDSKLDRFNLGRVARASRRATAWHWLAGRILRRPVAVAVSSAALLLLLTVPLLDIRIGFETTPMLLPRGNEVRDTLDRVSGAFGPGAITPVRVVTNRDRAAAVRAIRHERGIAAIGKVERGRNGWTLIDAFPQDPPNTNAAKDTVRRLRADESQLGGQTYVGGDTALGLDVADQIVNRLPLLIGLTVLSTLILLFAAFRAVTVPIKAVLTNLLSVGAAVGITVGLFQWVGDDPFLAYYVPLFLFAVLFGLSMDYEVFMLSRMREAHDRGASPRDAVAEGLIRSGRPITLAALVMITVFLPGATSQLAPFRQVGVGMAVAVLLDATIVRCLLVPSTVALLGRRNWWMPDLGATFARWRSALKEARS